MAHYTIGVILLFTGVLSSFYGIDFIKKAYQLKPKVEVSSNDWVQTHNFGINIPQGPVINHYFSLVSNYEHDLREFENEKELVEFLSDAHELFRISISDIITKQGKKKK